MIRRIVVRTRFSAIHCWPDCPYPEEDYLKERHRHEFWVEMRVRVQHNDREIEFIRLKNELDYYVRKTYHNQDLGVMSCEMIAEELLKQYKAEYVSVFEDGENGVEVCLGE